ncbi:MAG: O-antigen ligase family protein [Phycisphaerales bacterium]
MTDAPRQPPLPAGLLPLAAALVALVLVRAQSAFDPFPFWSSDPTIMEAPTIAITPAKAVLFDVLTLLNAAALVCRLPAALRPGPIAAAAFAASALAAVARGLVNSHAPLDDLIIGAGWTSAVGAAIALHAASALPALRRFLLACLTGAIAAVSARAVVQVFIEHPMSVRTFLQTKSQVFEAQGWSPGSQMALSYERRIMQADASAWFGISNILATFASACGVFFTGLLAAGLRRDEPSRRATSPLIWCGLCLGLVASVGTLYLTGSKGGGVAFALGIGVLATGFLARRAGARLPPWTHRWLGAAAVAASLGAVGLRGIIGDRIGELSLLFRSFYLEASARIFAQNPWGVGPSGFKDAYLLAKNPLSPEDVASPHNILADWMCCLGIAGLGWCALWLIWISGAASQSTADAADDQTEDRPLMRAAFITLAAPALFGAMIEQRAATPEGLMIRLGSIILGAVIASAVLRGMTFRAIGPALAGAACTLAAHAQIELTPTAMASCGWFLCLCAALGGRTSRPAKSLPWATPVALLGIAGVIASQSPRVWRWESALTSAAAAVERLPELRARRDALARGKALQPGDTPLGFYNEISKLAGGNPTPPQNLGEAIDATLARVRLAAVTNAARDLEYAAAATPWHFETLRALSSLDLELQLSRTPANGLVPASEFDGRLEAFATATGKATAWGWLGVLRDASAERSRLPEAREAAYRAWERASEAAPHDPSYASRAAFAALAAGRKGEAAELAARALRVDEQMRLDPLRQLPKADRARLEQLRSGG